MKRKIIIFLSIVAVLFGIYCVGIYIINNVFHAYHGKITLKVVDNDGHIVTNANVAVYFANQLFRNREYYKGVTDKDGCFTAKGMSQGDIIYKITKKGYYTTSDSYWFTKEGTTERDKLRPWMVKYTPWNPTLEVVLKEIRNPIPMYYKRISKTVPLLNTEIGFDLLKGDWVIPYGVGEANDLIFIVSGYYNGLFDRESYMNVSFAHGGGIKQLNLEDYSGHKSVYMAPLDGYSTNYFFRKIIVQEASQRENSNPREDIYFICEIKKLHNKSEKTFYGLIRSDFTCDYRNKKDIGVYFNYYFNPTPNDRNLEWNGSNLFDNTQWECHPSLESGRLK